MLQSSVLQCVATFHKKRCASLVLFFTELGCCIMYLKAANVGLMSLANIGQLGAELVQLPEIVVCQLFSVLMGRTSLQGECSKREDR